MITNFSGKKSLWIMEYYYKKRRSGGNQFDFPISPSEFLTPFFETLLRFQVKEKNTSQEVCWGFDWCTLYKNFSDYVLRHEVHNFQQAEFLYICLCNRQSKNSCDILFIYVKLPNYMYSHICIQHRSNLLVNIWNFSLSFIININFASPLISFCPSKVVLIQILPFWHFLELLSLSEW